MKYSQQVLEMLRQAVSGQIDNFWDFSFKFNALFGEDENFAEAWDNENPEMFDALNDLELMMFLEEHDLDVFESWLGYLEGGMSNEALAFVDLLQTTEDEIELADGSKIKLVEAIIENAKSFD